MDTHYLCQRLHQYCPGDTRFELTSPVFSKVIYHLPDGKTFTILAHNNSPEHIYIGSSRLNGKPLDELCIDYSEVMRGGTLELEME